MHSIPAVPVGRCLFTVYILRMRAVTAHDVTNFFTGFLLRFRHFVLISMVEISYQVLGAMRIRRTQFATALYTWRQVFEWNYKIGDYTALHIVIYTLWTALLVAHPLLQGIERRLLKDRQDIPTSDYVKKRKRNFKSSTSQAVNAIVCPLELLSSFMYKAHIYQETTQCLQGNVARLKKAVLTHDLRSTSHLRSQPALSTFRQGPHSCSPSDPPVSPK